MANEELQKIYDLFIKKYSNGEMTKDEFISENLRLNGGSEQFWEEMFHQFESKKTGRINVKGLFLKLSLSPRIRTINHSNNQQTNDIFWSFRFYS